MLQFEIIYTIIIVPREKKHTHMIS